MNDAKIRVAETESMDQIDEFITSFYLNIKSADDDLGDSVEQEDAALYELYGIRTEQPPTPHSELIPRYGLQQIPAEGDDALSQLESMLRMAFAVQQSMGCYGGPHDDSESVPLMLDGATESSNSQSTSGSSLPIPHKEENTESVPMVPGRSQFPLVQICAESS